MHSTNNNLSFVSLFGSDILGRFHGAWFIDPTFAELDLYLVEIEANVVIFLKLHNEKKLKA